MRTLFAMILMAASVLATPALAAMSAVNPALMHNQDKRPNNSRAAAATGVRLRDDGSERALAVNHAPSSSHPR
jgi:hypothetical protein